MEQLELPTSIKPRRAISAAGEPFLQAMIAVIERHQEFALTREQVDEFNLPPLIKAKD